MVILCDDKAPRVNPIVTILKSVEAIKRVVTDLSDRCLTRSMVLALLLFVEYVDEQANHKA